MKNRKESVYQELCEMGKLGLDIKYPTVFRLLETTDLDKEFPVESVSQICDSLIERS